MNDEDRIAELTEAMHHTKDRRMYERYPAVLLYLVGYPMKEIARIHHAKLLQPFLEKHKDQLEFVFLPPYSSKYNLIEGLWEWLKETVINNVLFPTVKKIRRAVESFLFYVNDRPLEVIDRLNVQLRFKFNTTYIDTTF